LACFRVARICQRQLGFLVPSAARLTRVSLETSFSPSDWVPFVSHQNLGTVTDVENLLGLCSRPLEKVTEAFQKFQAVLVRQERPADADKNPRDASGGSTGVAWGGFSHPKKFLCHPSSHPK